MRSTLRTCGIILSCSFLSLFLACGGGGGSSTPSSKQNANDPPVATAPTYLPNDASLSEYTTYAFSTSASDIDVGVTVASCTWNFGDGSAKQTATLAPFTVSHAYAKTGTFTVSVTPTDSRGIPGSAATTSVQVVAGTNPFVVTINQPPAAVPLAVSVGQSVTQVFDFTVTVTSPSFSYNAAGLQFSLTDTVNDTYPPLAQIAPNSNEWQTTVTFPADTASGTRTVTPTIQVTDTTGQVSSGQISFPAVTIQTLPSAAPPPTVSLAASPAIIVPGTTNTEYQNVPVTFIATATDAVVPNMTYSWSFGDGGKGDLTKSSALSVAHTYANPGVYTVIFTADTGIPGAVRSTTMAMQILPDTAPVISFSAAPSPYYVGMPVTFTATDTVNGQTPTYTWDFGDGSTATGSPVVHTFQSYTAANVVLTADDGKGGVTHAAKTLTILADVPPVAGVVTGPPGVVNFMQSKSYAFTASATEPSGGNPVTSFIWNWGDGSATQTDSTHVSALTSTTFSDTLSHSFPAGVAATYSVTVQAVDSLGSVGAASPATAFNVVPTLLPAATFTVPTAASTFTLPLGSSVSVTFTLSVTNPNGAPGVYLPASALTVYPLGILNPTVASNVTSNGDGTYNVTYAYPAGSGTGSVTYTPAAQATDATNIVGAVASGQPVIINTVTAILPPVVTMTATPAILAGANTTYQGVPIQFAASASDPNGDALYYSWNFGDGTVVAPTSSAAALGQTHAFAAPGIYTVTFTATDTLPGGTNFVQFNIQVLGDTKPNLTVTVNPAASWFVAAPISFSVVDNTPNQTPIYTWNFGDGTPAVTGAAQTHTFLASGLTVVTLTADDQKGGVTSWTQTLNIQPNIVPVAQAVQGPAGNLLQSKTYPFTATARELVGTNSVASFVWSWGDGTPNTTDNSPANSGNGVYTSSMTHVFPAGAPSFNANITVVPVDNHGAVGVTSPATSFPVINTTLPVLTFVTPAAPVILNVSAYTPPAAPTTVTETLTFTVTNPQAAVGATDPLPPAGIHFLANDAAGLAAVGPISSLGGGQYSVVVTYTAATSAGSRPSTPTAYAVDSLGVQGLVATAPTTTVVTQAATPPPSITVTSPASPTASVYTSDTVTLDFTLTDQNGDPVTYTVNWGDGTSSTGTTTTSTAVGAPVSVTHVFADAFAATTNPALAAAVISATDNRSTNGTATPKTVTYTVTYNTYPTAVITSPQASATIPAAVAAISATLLPAVPIVVLPNNGKLTFLGNTTAPGSALVNTGDAGLTYVWSFPGGVPSTYAGPTPPEVSFPGTPGQVTAYLVSFTVTDVFGRSSGNATGLSPTTYQRWVVVDGTDSQNFYLSFLYRQRSGTSSPDTYSYANLGSHGYGDTVTIYQDGLTNTYVIANVNAPTTIPVRSDVSFWLTVPGSIAGDTADGTNYQVNIPNAHGIDPDLEGTGPARTLAVSEGTAFAFQNWGATAPFNPQLQITTGSGFGTENNGADQRRFQGDTDLLDNECFATGTLVLESNLRWLDRLSVPTSDPLPALTQWIEGPNLVSGFSGLRGYQLIPEWFVFLKACETRDWNTLTGVLGGFTTAGTPTDLGFVVSDSFNADNVSSKHLAISAMQAFRAPASTLDPYDFDVMKSNLTSPAGSTALNDGDTPEDTTQGLNPTPVDSSTTLAGNYPAATHTDPLTFMNGLVNSPSSGALAGGLYRVQVPYDANDVNRIPSTSNIYHPYHSRANFGYAEYLWTKVWARPVVINRTNLSYADTFTGFTGYPSYSQAPIECVASGAPVTTENVQLPFFFYSHPTNRWPYATGVSPTNSSYDLTVANGGTFDGSSPVTENGNVGTNHGVGRFFWTAFTPEYNADLGSLISRTWLADSVTNQIPTAFPNASNGVAGITYGDAATAWGLLPPQDTMIDKRSRNLDGTANSGTLGGYRVTWFNPTKDAVGNVVPPDFWAIQVISDGKTYMYLVSSNYPRTTQLATSPLMTDARAFLNLDGTTSSTYQTFVPASGNTPASGSLAGPGYCWFDIPNEVRPQAGTATVTVFGLKAILANNAIQGARTIDRIEWIEAVKTVTASISTVSGGIDQSFAHKIPFNYAWDIVVVNGASTPVAP